jgi:hypothetical protein
MVRIWFTNPHNSDERLAGVKVDPFTFSITICQATKAIALDLDGNGEVFFGLNKALCAF